MASSPNDFTATMAENKRLARQVAELTAENQRLRQQLSSKTQERSDEEKLPTGG